MMCNSCWGEINDNQPTVQCQQCGKTIHESCAINDGGTFCDLCYIKNSSKKENFIDFEIPQVIRRSYIQTYKDCPYQFYKEVICGEETKIGSHAQVGIDFHDLAEDASLGNLRTPEDLTVIMGQRFDKYDDKMFEKDLILYKDMTVEKLKEKLWEQCCVSAYVLFDVLSILPRNAYALEENIEFSVGEDLPKVSITMDRVDLIDGELEITDWKTGTVMVGQRLSSDLQAPLYILAVQDKYKIPVRKFTFRYLSENKERVFERINAEEYECVVGNRKYIINLTKAMKEVQGIFSQIMKGNFNVPIDTRSMYYTCKVCGIREKGLCEGADTQVWKQYNK